MRKFWDSKWGCLVTILFFAIVSIGIMFVPQKPVSAYVVLLDGQKINSQYSGQGSLYGISLYNSQGERSFYPYEKIDSYCVYFKKGKECHKIDHNAKIISD